MVQERMKEELAEENSFKDFNRSLIQTPSLSPMKTPTTRRIFLGVFHSPDMKPLKVNEDRLSDKESSKRSALIRFLASTTRARCFARTSIACFERHGAQPKFQKGCHFTWLSMRFITTSPCLRALEYAALWASSYFLGPWPLKLCFWLPIQVWIW